jgi:hypothetical protein
MTEALTRTGKETVTDTHQQGSRLIAARVLWGIIALVCLVILITSIPAYVTLLQQVCPASAVVCENNQLMPVSVDALARIHISLGGYITYVIILDLIASLVFIGTGTLIFWRRSNDWFALFVSLILGVYGTLGPGGNIRAGALGVLNPGGPLALLVNVLELMLWPALGLFFYLFPTGRPVPRWSWVFVILWIIQLIFYLIPADSLINSSNLLPILQLAIYLSAYGSALACLVYRYVWASAPDQRQQMKWLVVGIAGGIILKLSLLVTTPFVNTLDALPVLIGVLGASIALLPIPLAISVAIFRYRLWDIDVIIKRTLVYGLLTLILALVYLGLVFGGEALLVRIVGKNDGIVIVGSTLIVALLFQPLRRGIQNVIDRRFYRQKYNAQHTLQAFNASLREEVDLTQLSEHIVAVVQETIQPATVSLWLLPSGRKALPLLPDSPEGPAGSTS